jgi:cytoskeletal protein CcmA (bactofilin family)
MSDKPVFCGKCGAESFLGAHFCMRCGGQISEESKDVPGPGTLRQPLAKPAAPAVRQSPPAALGAELADIDRSFDSLVAGPPVASAPSVPEERIDPRQAFRVLAQEHLRPIRDFMIELDVGVPDDDAVLPCSAAIALLEQPARALGLEPALMTALAELSAAFARLKGASAERIADERAILKRAYGALVKALPGGSSSGEHTIDLAPAPGNPAVKSENTMENGSSPKEKRTVVEEGSHFKGTLSSSCPVDVRGRIDGEVETPSLSVSASGAVHGVARVGAVRSEGELAGEFDADTVELSGVVKDNTVIRARSMQVKLSSERGKLQVIFGECELPAADAKPETSGAGAGVEPVDAPTPPLLAPPADPGPTVSEAADSEARAEGGFASEETGTGRRARRQRGSRHSEPPPAIG